MIDDHDYPLGFLPVHPRRLKDRSVRIAVQKKIGKPGKLL
jgi:hypothetical protein